MYPDSEQRQYLQRKRGPITTNMQSARNRKSRNSVACPHVSLRGDLIEKTALKIMQIISLHALIAHKAYTWGFDEFFYQTLVSGGGSR